MANGVASAGPAQLLEPLNDRSSGVPIFLVPGAGMQAGGFRALGSLLPVPAYGVSWPKDAWPRERWPATLTELAALVLEEVRRLRPSGPYLFSGHSFGATVALEMARLAELSEERVALVALLDPRSLRPASADLSGTFGGITLADTLALLSQSAVGDGARYAEQMEQLAGVEADRQEEVLQRGLGATALGMLRHVHETSRWYADLLAGGASADEPAALSARVAVLSAKETWREEVQGSESRAETTVREFQAAIFQTDAEVAERLARWCGGAAPTPARLPGGHFAMLNEPHVVPVALRLCQAIADAGIEEWA